MRGLIAFRHFFKLLGEQHVTHPAIFERHAAFAALDEIELPAMSAFEPIEKFAGVSDGRREQQQARESAQVATS